MSDIQTVAFLCHPYHRGGVTRWMADAAIAWAKKGLQVYFATPQPVKQFHSAQGRETMLQLLDNDRNSVHILTAQVGSEFEFGTAAYRAYVYKKLLSRVPSGTPIILSDDGAVWAAAAAMHNSYPVIGVLHADEEQYYHLAGKYQRWLSAFVCVSARVHTTVQQRIPEFIADHIYTIPCGINLPSFTVPALATNLLQLVYVGRVSDYQKRTGDLVNICALLAKKSVEFQLKIIGDGEAKTTLENKFKQERLEHLVTFYGWLSKEQVSTHLSQSDVLVLTSDFEGMPIAMMEALSVGCAVVGTRVSGLEDYEYDKRAADCLSVFEVGNIEDAVSKIKHLAAIPKSIRQSAARKLATSEFSLDVCLNRYLKIINGIEASVLDTATPVKLSLLKICWSRVLSYGRVIKIRLTK